jgi:aminopeptidase N
VPYISRSSGLALALTAAAGVCTCVPARSPGKSAPASPDAAGIVPHSVQECAGASAVDVLHHDVDLSLSLEPPSLSGDGEVRVRAHRDTRAVTLDARGLRVSQVAAGGPLRFEQSGDRLCVHLPSTLAAGRELTLRMAWQVPTTSDTPHFSAEQVWAGYAASAWLPTLQDSAQRATLSLRLKTSASLKAGASGRLVAETSTGDGFAIHSFVLDRPSPPFLYAFAAGHFGEAELMVDGVRLRAFGPAGADLHGALAITAPMLRFLVDRTGAPLPTQDYLQVFVNGDEAQEAAGLALLSADSLDDVRRDPHEDWIFSHELSHQWFAWLVPCVDFSDFWLNEGFATFMVAAVKERTWGRAAYDREVTLWRKRSAEVHAKGRDAPVSLSAPGGPPHAPPADSELQPRGVTYARGALVLDRLRKELGEDAFWAGIRRYVTDRTGKGARSEDLRTSLEAASGRDLKSFFDRWVYSPAPDL